MKIITGNTSKKIFDMDIGKGKPATTIIIKRTNQKIDKIKKTTKKDFKLS